MRPERVQKVLGEFQSIFDGEFIKSSGVGEGVAREGHFSFIGCITPQCLAQHYRYMGRIGSRFLFYHVPRQTDAERREGFRRVKSDRSGAKNDLNHLVCDIVAEAQQAPLTIDDTDDTRLEELAEFLALGRAMPYWARGSYQEDWELEDTQIEEPYRIFEQLRTLSHALALIHGRSEVTDHEIALIRRVVLSTVQPDRATLMLGLRGKSLSFKECEGELNKSYGTTAKTLKEMERLGMVGGH
jgi:hypothetical protein